MKKSMSQMRHELRLKGKILDYYAEWVFLRVFWANLGLFGSVLVYLLSSLCNEVRII